MDERILLSHGEGGRRTRDLIRDVIAEKLGNPVLSPLYDAGILGRLYGEVAFTTDSYVVTPPVFPGGDIGRLAVCGTLNDLAVCGARPVAISCSLILEEGLPIRELAAILDSMRAAAEEGNVLVACGDTKVVDRGKADGMFVNTTGVGFLHGNFRPQPRAARPGDAVVVSGPMGRHGMAIMAVREGFAFESEITSDTANLAPLVAALRTELGDSVHVLRDATRGGVASALNEIATASGVQLFWRGGVDTSRANKASQTSSK